MCPWVSEGLSLRSVPLLWDVVGLILRVGVVFIIGGDLIGGNQRHNRHTREHCLVSASSVSVSSLRP